MNSAVLHSMYVGIPLGTFLLLWVMTHARKSNHPATYTMSERWTHEPILWAAVDETVPDAGHGHGDSALTVGGGASGRW